MLTGSPPSDTTGFPATFSAFATRSISRTRSRSADAPDRVWRDEQQSPPSTNVTDLQRRVVGVLPIAANVPRTGISYQFVRALAVDEETKVTFRYRTR